MAHGYLLAYFKTSDEALYLALSEGGLDFRDINSGFPVLRSTIGNRSIRDPFIFRDEKKGFKLLATDGYHGKCIFYSESNDMKNWAPSRLIRPFPPFSMVRNVWAPKAIVSNTGGYTVLWSSTKTLLPLGRPNNHRIWSAHTIDFINFAKAKIWFDPNYNTIDLCPYRHQSDIYAAFKDERGTFGRGRNIRAIRVIQGNRIDLSNGKPSEVLTETATEGPCLYRRGEQWCMIYDKYLEGSWGALTSEDFKSWDTVGVTVPTGARHGSVVELSAAEFEMCLSSFST